MGLTFEHADDFHGKKQSNVTSITLPFVYGDVDAGGCRHGRYVVCISFPFQPRQFSASQCVVPTLVLEERDIAKSHDGLGIKTPLRSV
jgi:hypothetical protein